MKRSLLLVLALFTVLAVVGCGGGDDAAVEYGPNDAPEPGEGVVQVALVWDQAVDLDLEIWDENGVNAITSAGLLTGSDVLDGTKGAEYIDFTDYEDEDLSSGSYVMSVYFAEEAETVASANARLIVTDADGDVTEYDGEVMWEQGSDQWHAIEIDGATGEFSEINEYVLVETPE
jgi:hypothetical protein